MHFPRFEFPPGPSYILHQLLSLKVAGYAAFVGCIHFGGEMLGIGVPFWIIVPSSIIALPIAFYAQGEFQYWRDKRKAESLGARLAPKVPYKWPGGIDLMAALIETFKTGYIGESDGLGLLYART